jgi:ribosomal protein L23
LSKPEIKQYLLKIYNLKIQKVNTARFMGKVVANQKRKYTFTKSFKKAFVVT